MFFSIVVFSQSTTVNFNYTGSAQNWVIPPCVTTITVSVAGAEGGGANGGNGALLTGNISVTAGQTLQITVGGSGTCPNAGYNGGGLGASANTSANGGCGGGGATDIRTTPFQINNRIIIAAGGGGMGGGNTDADGGNGGCSTGTIGTSPFGVGGDGGSQNNGGNGGPPWITSGNFGGNGSLGNGGNGATDPCYNVGPGGGGGGGYYGGGGGGSDCFASGSLGGGGGGGGSSLTPAGCSCVAGINNNNGYVIITYVLANLDAGNDNTLVFCDTDSSFNMWNQLLGTPDNGGVWYNNTWAATGSNFDPSSWVSGTYAYVVGGTSSCTADTSFLTVNINPTPILNFPALNDVCSNNAPINLAVATPAGGNYSGIGVTTNIFTPNINVLGNNTITYNYTDTNGCSNSTTQNITVNDLPFATSTTTNASCNGFTDGSAILTISGGTPNYTTNWGGYNDTALSAGTYSYIVTDTNSCTFTDSIIIYEPGAFTSSVNTTNVSCNGSNNGTANVQVQGSSTPAGTVSTLSYCMSTPGSSTASTIDNIQLIGDSVDIDNNTTGACDQYEDYTNQYADITAGQSYTIDVTLGDCSNNYPSGGKVYIDWNIDGDFFDIGEEIGTIPVGPPSTTTTIPFTVPFSGAYGATRMRIVSQFLNSIPVDSIGPCDVGVMANPVYIQPWFGATEDYSIVISAANITATYIWSNGLTTDSVSGLSAGNYTIDITDGNGCTITDSVTITEPPAISTTTSQNNISCFGYSDGSISLTINGGIPDYTINAAGYSQ
ncbi:MAG TPA: hypothetical protein EYQ09_06635, partial [Flavobacteriales bacterium]|nr:hypothetical protein [Flavobacteriales bacterium]